MRTLNRLLHWLQAEYEAGAGTHVKDAFICASLAGVRRIVPPASAAELVSRRRSTPVLRATALSGLAQFL